MGIVLLWNKMVRFIKHIAALHIFERFKPTSLCLLIYLVSISWHFASIAVIDFIEERRRMPFYSET